ncbi:hypothetical protein ACROYT_G038075 [Oculina patagonica]
MKSHLPSVHTYADDTQLYISFNPVDNTSEAEAVTAIENCIQDVRAWMRDDKLMLNDDKTEFLIIGTERQLSRVSVDKIKIGQAEVSPVSSVRNLGTWFDSHLDMSTHVTKACASAFYYLYNIRHIRKYLSQESKLRVPEVRDEFQLELRNRFSILQTPDQNDMDTDGHQKSEPSDPANSIEQRWQKIKNAYTETAINVLGAERRGVGAGSTRKVGERSRRGGS